MKTLAVALNTVREALHERLNYNLLAFAGVLILASVTISELTVGEQYRIVVDISLSAAQLFGVLIATLVGVGLVAREIDRRTAAYVVSKPLPRAAFVAGRYLGLLAVLTANFLVMVACVLIALFVYKGDLSIAGRQLFAAMWLMWVEFALCAAVALLFSSFTTTTLATIFSLGVVAAGHLAGEVRPTWAKAGAAGSALARASRYLVPDLEALNLREAVTYLDPVSWGDVAQRTAYALAYAVALVALAAVIFTRRDLK